MRAPRVSVAAAGFALIWAFLIVFVLYPLTRIFYDAFTTEAGPLTFANTAATCFACNQDKGHLSDAEYRAVLEVRRQAAA